VTRLLSRALAAGAALAAAPPAAAAQAVSVTAAHWFTSPPVSDYQLSVSRLQAGPLALVPHARLAIRGPRADRAVLLGVGGDLALRAARRTYLVAGVGAGFVDLEGSLGLGLWSAWSAGAGFELLQTRAVAVAVEVRYQRLSRGDVAGVSLGGRVGTPLGRGRRAGPAAAARDSWRPGRPVAGAAGQVVETALDAMGAPYRWGGSDANGFDCSGLIQFAYARIGVGLPRRSVDQARAGVEVPLDPARLRPGDILAFGARPGGPVTHVGLFVGDGRFIHSASDGVRISRLAPDDPDGAWWLARWVGARRVTGD
jgi:cell wall-associated NlpC family hydrolase